MYKPGKDVTAPKLVHEVKPRYTEEAKQARIQGMVTMDVVVLENGTAGDVSVTKSLDTEYGLDNEAVKAAKQWLFEPGRKDGKAVAVVVTVEMSFALK